MDLGLEAEIIGFGPFAIPDNPFPRERIHALPIAFPAQYRYSPALSKWIENQLGRFDGVILHGMWLYPNVTFSTACRRANLPYICFPHGMLEPWALYGHGVLKAVKKILYWVLREKTVFQHAAAVFFTTERERRLAQETFVLPDNTFIVVPYGVEALGRTALEPERADLKFHENQKVALFLGRLHPKKNVRFLIEAWAKSRPHPDWLLIIAGPAEAAHQRSLKQLTAKYGLEGQVRFVGPVSGLDKAYLLGRALWFLLPSEHENFGVAVLEAINAGCPVVISDQVYLGDYFDENSEILPIRLEQWVDFLSVRMQDEQHRKDQIRILRERLMPRFSMDVIVHDWAATITSSIRAAAKLSKH